MFPRDQPRSSCDRTIFHRTVFFLVLVALSSGGIELTFLVRVMNWMTWSSARGYVAGSSIICESLDLYLLYDLCADACGQVFSRVLVFVEERIGLLDLYLVIDWVIYYLCQIPFV